MQGLLCFDYDRTLLDHATGKIPQSALEAIERARPFWKIAIATGRDMRLPDSLYGMETVKPDALIHMNGARVLAEGSLLCQFSWPKDVLARVVAFAAERGLCVGCQVGTTYYTTNEATLRNVFQKGIYAPPERILPAEKLLQTEISALVLLGPAEDAAQLQQAFPALSVLPFAHSEGADVVPYHLSKADGMRRLCAYYGFVPEQVVVFGDSSNDLELFSAAGWSVAMGNAIPEVKEAADFVTKPIGEDGLAYAMEVLGLLDGRIPAHAPKKPERGFTVD